MKKFFLPLFLHNNGIPKGYSSLWSGQGLTALVGSGAKPHKKAPERTSGALILHIVSVFKSLEQSYFISVLKYTSDRKSERKP